MQQKKRENNILNQKRGNTSKRKPERGCREFAVDKEPLRSEQSIKKSEKRKPYKRKERPLQGLPGEQEKEGVFC